MQWLSEMMNAAPLGTTVSWRTPSGPNMGVVIGTQGDDFIAVTMTDRSLAQDPAEQVYLDVKLTKKAGSLPGQPRVRVDVHRVPRAKAFLQHRSKGAALKAFLRIAKQLRSGKKATESRQVSSLVQELRRVFG